MFGIKKNVETNLEKLSKKATGAVAGITFILGELKETVAEIQAEKKVIAQEQAKLESTFYDLVILENDNEKIIKNFESLLK